MPFQSSLSHYSSPRAWSIINGSGCTFFSQYINSYPLVNDEKCWFFIDEELDGYKTLKSCEF